MRLIRFDLVRYGLFTDYSINFGDWSEAKPDFHIIYGDNETGKSTLRSAFLDLLFGIEKQSIYDFKHPYPTMRVGGVLEIQGAAHDLNRIKKDKNSLLGADDQPVSEAILSAVLGSIDRGGYEMMFSLEDDTLQEGGESILRSEGNIGQLLFSAASGLSELGRRLDEVKAEAHEFYKPRTRKHRLGEAKKRLQELKDRTSKIDLQANQYVALLEEESSARASYESAKAERDANKIRLDHVRRVLGALPAWVDLKGLRAKLGPLNDIPDLPEGWLTQAQELSRQDASARREAQLAKENVERLTEELEALEIDETILRFEQKIERLSDPEVRFRAAVDIPKLETERDYVDLELKDILKRLGRSPSDDPAILVLPAGTEGTINDLIERTAAVIEANETARDEFEKANTRVARCEKTLKDIGEAPDIAHLSTIVARVREPAHVKEIARLEKRITELCADIDEALIGLTPWSGDIDALADLAPPNTVLIGQWKETFSSLHEDDSALQRTLGDRFDDRDRLIVEIRAIRVATGVIDDAAAAEARARRTAAWEAHRAGICQETQVETPLDVGMLNSTADAFETAMNDDDHVGEVRLNQSTDVAALREAKTALIRKEGAIEKVNEKIAAFRLQMENTVSTVGSAMSALGLPADTDPSDLERWLDRREQVLAKSTEYNEVLSNLDAARQALAEADAFLTAAMTEAGLTVDNETAIDEKLDAADAEIERAKLVDGDVRSAKKTLEEAEQDVEDRERKSRRAAEALESWEELWTSTIKECWFGESCTARSVAEVREILHVLGGLSGKLEKRDGLKHRIEAMMADREKYVATVEVLASEVNEPFEVSSPLESADELRRRLTSALQKKNLRDVKQKEFDKALEHLREVGAQVSVIISRFDEMAAKYPSDDFGGLLEFLERAQEKSRLVEQIDRRQRELLEKLEGASLEEAEAQLELETSEASDVDALKAERTRLDSLLSDQDEQVSELFHKQKSAEETLVSVGGDAEVARIEEERRTVLLDIKEQADRYLQISIGALAAENALRVFRDRHRSTMMKSAGAAFSTITRGGFTDLTTTPGKDGELLVGLKAGGGSIVVSEMSKGTRFQLYLALRIAGYGEFVQHREALPFFADDIIETFDDDRSAETFQLLSEMARQGQVIYLTHHRHLCAIAERVCGKAVSIHELPELNSVL